MTTRYWDPAAHRYKIIHPAKWDITREEWEILRGFPIGGMVPRSMFSPYVGAGTVWQRDVSAMPLHTDSSTMAAWMWSESPTPYSSATGTPSGAFGSRTSFNRSVYGTQPIACIVVDSTDPDCQFQYMDSCALPGRSVAEQNAFVVGAIPWPIGFLPAQNGDRSMAIYDVGTGIFREYFNVVPVAGKHGHWTATTGGYSVGNPHFAGLASTNYPTQFRGSSAVVRMHNSLGFVGADEVRRGRIDHALAFTMANAIANTSASWPAMASDGKYPDADWSGWTENGGGEGPYPGPSPRHGQWGRLPSSVDPFLNPNTGLPYKPLTRLLIEAAKNYGLVGTDTNAWAHAFNAESGNREKLITGVDPWADSGELAQILNPASPSTAFAVDDFPWDLTQWAPYDWGRPNPDFNLRDDEVFEYEPHN